MSSALIGHTGFVGQNLAAQRGFDACFNSHNFRDLAGKSFDTVVCCGIQSRKWWSNENPDADLVGIRSLLDVLGRVQCREFILISTIDVYPATDCHADEATDLSGRQNHAYGRHRLLAEHWVREHFRCHRIVRLPALFGRGLKKNALFDLMHGNLVDRIHPLAEFQWYPLTRLASDLAVISTNGLSLVNLFPEPVAMRAIVDRFFPRAQIGRQQTAAPKYCLHTRYAEAFGGRDGYLLSAAAVMDAIAAFLAEQHVLGHAACPAIAAGAP